MAVVAVAAERVEARKAVAGSLLPKGPVLDPRPASQAGTPLLPLHQVQVMLCMAATPPRRHAAAAVCLLVWGGSGAGCVTIGPRAGWAGFSVGSQPPLQRQYCAVPHGQV